MMKLPLNDFDFINNIIFLTRIIITSVSYDVIK